MYIIIVVACYLENASGLQWPNTIDEIENEKKVTSKLYSFALWFSGFFNMASTPMSYSKTTPIQSNTISIAIIDSSNKDVSQSLTIQ